MSTTEATSGGGGGSASRTLRTHAVGAIAILAAAGAVYAAVIGPRFAAAELLTANRARLVQIQDDATRAGESAREAEVAAQKLAAELAKNGTTLKPASALNTIIAEITGAAESGWLTLSEITPGAEIAMPTHVKFPIRIRGKGSYPSVTRLIGILHARFGDLALVSFSLHADASDPKAPAAVVLDFEWYAVRNDAAGPASK